MSSNPAKSYSLPIFKDHLGSFLFIFPALAIFIIFTIFPFYQIFYLSLQDWNGISATKTFIGFTNFKDLVGDTSWWQSMGNAAYITVIALTFQNALAFALALACDREIRLKGFYRVVFFLPPVLSEVVVGFIWKWILNADVQANHQVGVLNYFLNSIGFTGLVHGWLADPNTALTVVALVHSWKGFGWGFIILLAGLQTIDRQLYEAAKMDGANSWSTFRHVTIPMMLPVIGVVVVLTILGSMQSYALIVSMMGQGLGDHASVPLTRILSSMNVTQQFGYACAQGVTFGIVLIGISLMMKKFSARLK